MVRWKQLKERTAVHKDSESFLRPSRLTWTWHGEEGLRKYFEAAAAVKMDKMRWTSWILRWSVKCIKMGSYSEEKQGEKSGLQGPWYNQTCKHWKHELDWYDGRGRSNQGRANTCTVEKHSAAGLKWNRKIVHSEIETPNTIKKQTKENQKKRLALWRRVKGWCVAV